MERGAPDAEPLLFVHCWGLSSAAFTELFDRLAGHYRVIAPDLPGFGRSPPFPGAVSYEAYADVLAGVLDERRIERAHVAGLSMGGGQALNFGLGNTDVFAWVGGFSSAPNTLPVAELVADPAAARQLELLWVSCGNEDTLFNISLGVHEYLSAQNVPHVWYIDAGAHTFPVWKNDLYHFASLLFR